MCHLGHERLHVVPWEESGYSVHDALPPAVIVTLQDVDDGVFREAQLVFLVGSVVVHGDHCGRWSGRHGEVSDSRIPLREAIGTQGVRGLYV